jgi:hypothetical protein
MLLTTYAFSDMGTLGNEAADTLFALAGVLLLVGIAFALVATRREVAPAISLAPSGSVIGSEPQDLAEVGETN